MVTCILFKLSVLLGSVRQLFLSFYKQVIIYYYSGV